MANIGIPSVRDYIPAIESNNHVKINDLFDVLPVDGYDEIDGQLTIVKLVLSDSQQLAHEFQTIISAETIILLFDLEILKKTDMDFFAKLISRSVCPADSRRVYSIFHVFDEITIKNYVAQDEIILNAMSHIVWSHALTYPIWYRHKFVELINILLSYGVKIHDMSELCVAKLLSYVDYDEATNTVSQSIERLTEELICFFEAENLTHEETFFLNQTCDHYGIVV